MTLVQFHIIPKIGDYFCLKEIYSETIQYRIIFILQHCQVPLASSNLSSPLVSLDKFHIFFFFLQIKVQNAILAGVRFPSHLSGAHLRVRGKTNRLQRGS